MTKDSEMERAWIEYVEDEPWDETNDVHVGIRKLKLSRPPNKLWADGFQAAKSASGWVKIEDIPEEWKDGRPIDLWVDNGRAEPFRLNNCRYRPTLSEGYSNWKTWNYHLKEGQVKFAMLPPSPPQAETG